MIIRDRIKAYITAQIENYLESGVAFCFENENRADTFANAVPSIALEDLPEAPYLEWPYKFEISATKSLGERTQHSFADFIQLLEEYRKVLGREMATREPLDINVDEHIVLARIARFSWQEKDQNIAVNITLEYSHIEEYDND
jgi:hypothetical protein